MAAFSKMHIRVLKARPNGSGPYRLDLTTPKEEGRRTEYGWVGPDRADKGKRAGSCNRTACQRPGAFWRNRGNHYWYCTRCAHQINRGDLDPLCVLDNEALEEYKAKGKA